MPAHVVICCHIKLTFIQHKYVIPIPCSSHNVNAFVPLQHPPAPLCLIKPHHWPHCGQQQCSQSSTPCSMFASMFPLSLCLFLCFPLPHSNLHGSRFRFECDGDGDGECEMRMAKWEMGKWVRKSRSKSCNAPARNCLMRLP